MLEQNSQRCRSQISWGVVLALRGRRASCFHICLFFLGTLHYDYYSFCVEKKHILCDIWKSLCYCFAMFSVCILLVCQKMALAADSELLAVVAFSFPSFLVLLLLHCSALSPFLLFGAASSEKSWVRYVLMAWGGFWSPRHLQRQQNTAVA